MRDSDVRYALHRDLLTEHSLDMESTRFVDELGLCGAVRVDVAVVNGALSGYELKSARDTIRRLPVQADYYSRVLDFATLVTAENHLQAADEVIPAWWGVLVAVPDGSGLTLEPTRPAEMNPKIDPYALAQLLWRDEVLVELSRRDLDRGYRSKPRTVLWQRLSNELPLDELRSVVRVQLKSRTGWRSDL